MESKDVITMTAIVVLAIAGITFLDSSQLLGKATAENVLGSKATVASHDIIDLGARGSSSGQPIDYTGYITILQAQIETSGKKDISAYISSQCVLLTDKNVQMNPQEEPSVGGTISMRIKATNINSGEVQYFKSSDYGATPNIELKGIPFCTKIEQLKVAFAELNCQTDLSTGIITCSDSEKMNLLLNTLHGNAFNFMLPETSPGIWNIEVQALAESDVVLAGNGFGSGDIHALIGLGSATIEAASK